MLSTYCRVTVLAVLFAGLVGCGNPDYTFTPSQIDYSKLNQDSEFEPARAELLRAEDALKAETGIHVSWRQNSGLDALVAGTGDFHLDPNPSLGKKTPSEYSVAVSTFSTKLTEFCKRFNRFSLTFENAQLLALEEEKRDFYVRLASELANPDYSWVMKTKAPKIYFAKDVSIDASAAKSEALAYLGVDSEHPTEFSHVTHFAEGKQFREFKEIANPEAGYCVLIGSSMQKEDLENVAPATLNSITGLSLREAGETKYRGNLTEVSIQGEAFKLYCFMPFKKSSRISYAEMRAILGGNALLPDPTPALLQWFSVQNLQVGLGWEMKKRAN